MEPCDWSLFVLCNNVRITWIPLEPTNISLKEVGVSFGPHVKTTKLFQMSKWTIKISDSENWGSHEKLIPSSLNFNINSPNLVDVWI